MANTVIEIQCVPGTTTAYLTSLGGSGTADGDGYTLTQVAGYIHTITVPEDLTGRWLVACGDADGSFGFDEFQLADEAKTFYPSSPTQSGLYSLTVTVEDSSSNGVTGARVSIQGTNNKETTDSSGQCVFYVDAGTYTLAVSPPSGYETPATVDKTVSADDTQTIAVAATTVAAPSDPALATLSVKCLDKNGAAEAGVVLEARASAVPSSSTGLSITEEHATATSGADGVALLTVVRAGVYEIRRKGSTNWSKVSVPDSATVTVPSFIG